MSRSDNAGFRSDDSRRRYLAVYDRVRSRSPKPDVIHDLPTQFGIVRAYQHGADDGIPMVLLHCFWATSAMWADHVAALVGDFAVYTIDMLGQPGASVQSKSMITTNHCVRCINELLDRLSLRDVHLVGHSYGGWAALQTAARAPDRLASVTLIEPLNTVARPSKRFWRDGALLLLPNVERKKRIMEMYCGTPVAGSTWDRVLELAMAAGVGCEFVSFGTPVPRYVRDSRMRSVDVPVQVLLAGNTIHNSAKAIERIRAVAPSWSYRLWPNATHALPFEHPDEVSECVRVFVQERR